MKSLLRHERILILITTMQEAFSAIIPFFLLTSFVTLLYYLLRHFGMESIGLSVDHLGNLMENLNAFSSVIATLALAYFFAGRFRVSPVVASILAIAVFVTVLQIENPTTVAELPYGFTPAALTMPVLSTWLLHRFYPRLALSIPVRDGHHHIYRLFSYLFVFLAAYLASVLIYYGVDYVLDDLIERLNALAANIPGIIRLAIRDLFVQIFWFFGIHGEHVVNGLMGKDILFEPMRTNLSYGEFHRLFVSIGGAGVGMGLIVALVLHARRGTVWLLTKLSAPFVIFNINTLLLYGIVVLNRFLLLPFLLLPLLNLTLAYLALQWLPVHFTTYEVTWTTPVFFDTYLKGGGDLSLVLLQLGLLLLDILVYSRYVRRYVALSTEEALFRRLEERLDLPEAIRSREHLRSYAAHWEVMEANSRLETILERIDRDRLRLYYQPKIDPDGRRCDAYEALIRYDRGGQMVGPDFLEDLERAGVAPVIDRWVAYRVREDLIRWRREGRTPGVSINLHPDTVRDPGEIRRICRILEGEKVTFEIIERSFIHLEDAKASLELIREGGFGIAIDDFGAGYSSLETVTRYRIDELKLDKSLIDIVETRKGYLVCKHTVSLCHELGCRVVAEGVERPGQLERLRTIGIDLVQGYIYTRALPPEAALRYCQELEKAGGKGRD